MEGSSICKMSEDVPCSIRYRDSDSLRFMSGVCNRVPSIRMNALENIARIFDGWLEGYGSPHDSILIHSGDDDAIPTATNMRSLIREHLPDVLRLSIQCPYHDVREGCRNILQDLQVRGMKIPKKRVNGASLFIHENDIIPVDTDTEEVHNLFEDAFLHNNRLEHLVQLMGYHPKYLDCFLKTQQFVLRGDGPLPYDYRHYIAIMAAGRHQCSYLINIQRNEFLLQGGDPTWLNGLDCIPQKLRNLYEINKILAHRPWLINQSHIERLTRGDDNWSLSELTHAIVLLAQFHALSSFVYACGVNAEVDHDDGHSSRSSSLSDDGSATVVAGKMSPHSAASVPASPETAGGIEALMERMKRLTEEAQEEMTPEELLKTFERVETQSAELTAAAKQPCVKADILRYVTDAEFTYQDFAKRGQTSEIPTFRAQDYSWEEQGFSLANRLYSDIGNLLDDKFTTTYNLTYYTMGENQGVDTTAFRHAIWNYIHCMFGIRHDDYDYSEVNQLLERSLKAYIKVVTCFPERITNNHYNSFMHEFHNSEKIHVNLMLLEARLQAELLYALRAIMRYMT